MKQLFIYVLFIFVSFSANGNNQLDSLQQIVSKKEGWEKLNILWQISRLKMGNNLEDIHNLENEAKRQSNHLYAAVAYQHRVACYELANIKSDSLLYYINVGIDEFSKVRDVEKLNESDKRLYYRVGSLLGGMTTMIYVRDGKYDLALITIEKMLQDSEYGKITVLESESYYSIGSVYLYLKKSQEALTALKKGLNLYKKLGDYKNYDDEFKFYPVIMQAYFQLNDFDSVIVLGNTLLKTLDEAFQLKNNQIQYDRWRFSAYSDLALSFIKKGELTKAREYLNKANSLYSNVSLQYKEIYHSVETEYYLATGNIKSAKTHLDMAFQIDSMVSTTPYNYISLNLLKVTIQEKAGEKDKALNLLHHTFQFNDSVIRANFSSQFADLETIYRVDKLEDQAKLNEARLRTTHFILAASIVMIFLLLMTIYVMWRAKKKQKEKNLQLYKKHSEIENKNEEIEELKQKENLNNKQKEIDPYQIIIQKLDEYMKESGDYKNPQITRDELALKIGTNRQYLIDAIKEKKRQTFNEYLYSLRLKHAYNLLINDKSKSITDIYIESGFVTRSVFNKEFKAVYDMTPSELRGVV